MTFFSFASYGSTLQELQELKQEKQQLQQKCEQQEQALQEMGLHLSQSVTAMFFCFFFLLRNAISRRRIYATFIFLKGLN